MDLGLVDRVYVVSGGSGGLGLATARVLVAEGARVVLGGRDPDRLASACADLGAAALGVAGDNADPDLAQRQVAAGLDRWGRLDGALVSVGGPPRGTALETDDATWLSSFETVFLGSLRLARAVAAGLTGPDGSIAFVLSTSVRSPLAFMATSNGLRPGLGMLAKQLADELGPRGVRVNALLPGRIATDRVRSLDAATGDASRARASAEAAIPLGRYGVPEEFGRAAAFLLSPASSFVSGAMLPVDGGASRAL